MSETPRTTAQAALQAEFYVGDLAQAVLESHDRNRNGGPGWIAYQGRMAAWKVLVDEDSTEEALAIARHLAAAKAVAFVSPL